MKNKQSENFLEKIPCHQAGLNWSKDDDGSVTLEKENKGIANRIAQKLIKKPRISYIHLEKMGSFIWPLIDGNRTVLEIGELVKEHFGDDAEPLYERLSQYLKTFALHGFITFK